VGRHLPAARGLIEGTTPAVIVTDVLPAGPSHVSHQIAAAQPRMVLGNPAYDTRLGTARRQPNLGDVAPGNGSTTDDFVDVETVARRQRGRQPGRRGPSQW
jgi:hypothetical protein